MSHTTTTVRCCCVVCVCVCFQVKFVRLVCVSHVCWCVCVWWIDEMNALCCALMMMIVCGAQAQPAHFSLVYIYVLFVCVCNMLEIYYTMYLNKSRICKYKNLLEKPNRNTQYITYIGSFIVIFSVCMRITKMCAEHINFHI